MRRRLGTGEVGMGISWGLDYVWGVPVIVLTVVIHAYGLGWLNSVFRSAMTGAVRLRNLPASSGIIVGGTVLSVIILHVLECAIWAASYRYLGALQDSKGAMLYSLNAMT